MVAKVSGEALDSVFSGLLCDFPAALVGALDAEGGFVTVPDSVPLDGHGVVADGSLLSMVAPADRVVVSDAWTRLEGQGFMMCLVHLVSDPERSVRVHLTDMRHRYGVFLGVFVPDGEDVAGLDSSPPEKPVVMLVTDEAAVYTHVDEAVSSLLGWAPSEMIGRRALEFIHPDDHDPAVEGWIQLLSSGQSLPVRFRHQRRDKTWLWVEFRNNLFRGATGTGYVICEMLDVSSEMSETDSVGSPRAIRPRLAMVHKDELAMIIGVDHAATQLLGWSAQELVGKRSLDLIHPDDHARAIATWARILTTGTRQRVRLRHQCSDGSWIWVEITNHLIAGEPGKGQVVAEMLDVSEEMAAQEALRRRERLFRRLTESLPAGLFQIDREGRVVYANARLQEILGASPAETATEQLAAVHEDDQDRTRAAVAAVLAGADEDIEVRVRPPGPGNVLLCTLTLRSLPEEDGEVSGALIMVTDVTESARLRAELEVRATYDALTSCYNRASIMAILESELARSDGLVGAVFIDLDGFKQVNDRYGHAAGDELLVLLAERLRASVRSGDLVARIGGDEFLVVSLNVTSSSEAFRVAERLRQALEVVAELSSGRTMPRASFGVACANAATITAHGLIALADTAMYESKRLGMGRPVAIDALRAPAPNPS